MFHPETSSVSRRRMNAVRMSLLMLALVALPVVQNFREDPDDGFPLSYFPMFTTKREATTEISHPIGFRADGSSVDLHYKLAGGGGMNQIRRQIREIVKDDDADDLCKRVAKNVARSSRRDCSDVIEVAIVSDTYRYDLFFNGQPEPVEREFHARCGVRGQTLQRPDTSRQIPEVTEP